MPKSVAIEGAGGLECSHPSHDGKVFKADSYDELEKHYQDGKHTVTGAGLCAVCGTGVEHGEIPYGTKPMCDDCKTNMLESMK